MILDLCKNVIISRVCVDFKYTLLLALLQPNNPINVKMELIN